MPRRKKVLCVKVMGSCVIYAESIAARAVR
jgi:hypothetical protein